MIKNKFKVGDKVSLKKRVKAGDIYGDITIYNEMLFKGTLEVIEVYNDDTVCLSNGYYYGINCLCKDKQKKHFKSLPRNYTGTIEVENGFIVEKEILDEVEKEYLRAVIKPFRNSIKNIIKKEVFQKSYIDIHLYNNDDCLLPNFETEKMYKGMEQNKEYTLKELGLDE